MKTTKKVEGKNTISKKIIQNSRNNAVRTTTMTGLPWVSSRVLGLLRKTVTSVVCSPVNVGSDGTCLVFPCARPTVGVGGNGASESAARRDGHRRNSPD